MIQEDSSSPCRSRINRRYYKGVQGGLHPAADSGAKGCCAAFPLCLAEDGSHPEPAGAKGEGKQAAETAAAERHSISHGNAPQLQTCVARSGDAG